MRFIYLIRYNEMLDRARGRGVHKCHQPCGQIWEGSGNSADEVARGVVVKVDL